MDFLELAHKRYSVRRYSGRPIEEEKLLKLLEAARLAPTGCNNQPQHIYILKSTEALQKAASVTPYTFQAPVIFLFTYNKDDDWKSPIAENYRTGEIDVSLTVSHVMFEAAELGLGSCMVGYFSPEKVKKVFDLPEDQIPVLLLPIGYPADSSHPSHYHDESKTLQELYTIL